MADQGPWRFDRDSGAWAAAAVAFIALLLGPLFQRWLILRQQKANVIAANRVRWIEEFRKDIATFCELAHHVAYCRIQRAAAERARDKPTYDKFAAEVAERTIALNTTFHHLILRCNPKKYIARQVRDQLHVIDGLCNEDSMEYEALYSRMQAETTKLIDLVRRHLASEWSRVENLE